MRLAIGEFHAKPAPIVPGLVLAQAQTALPAARRWRVEAIFGDPGSSGIRHARLVSIDDRRDLKTLAVAMLTPAHGWGEAVAGRA